MKSKIREAIKRLELIKPSEINPATWFQVKAWLFPRIIAYMDGYKEKEELTPEEMIDEVFKKDSGDST